MKTLSVNEIIRAASDQNTAEILIAHILSVPRAWLYTHPDYKIKPNQYKKFSKLMLTAIAGKPLAYIIGEWEFYSLVFKVDEHTLIPRPDTELLVEKTLESISPDSHILDLGTGCGCIAIALAANCPGCRITAVDNSAEALEITRENAKINKIKKLSFIQSSWYEQLPLKKYDVIVSNPPYIAKDDPFLSISVKDYEPRNAVIAPHGGFADIIKIARGSADFLKPGGKMLLEHGFLQGRPVRNIFKNHGFEQIKTFPDLGGNERVTMGIKNLR